MVTLNPIIQRSLDAHPLREPLLRSIIESLQLARGSHGLDAGCGIGLPAHLLAEAVGADGHITGLDILPDVLTYAEDTVALAGYGDRVSFCAGDVGRLPFADDAFDWAWSVDCIGYPVGDLQPVLTELARVVRPGGCIILLGWTDQQVLPGYPLLETRLNATCSGYLPYLRGMPPEFHFQRALRSFRAAGLHDVRARTFVGDVQAPLSGGERIALAALFEMLWGQPQPEVAAEDWQAYQQLCTPGSDDFILDGDDYYAFFTYSMFRGNVPGG
ncbi:MAG: methyltransferase domain-containing protein [Anaerolineae bacterium]|nr:methyltransferase domain-containing protein [Anaerolineae bacterium]